MNPNIRDPNIAAGIQALAQAFIPNSGAMIEADLNRHRRDGIIADTNRTNVDATRLDADRQRLLTDAQRTQGFMDADANIASVLADPNFNPADPKWRAALAAASAGAENGLADGPAGITGYSSFIDPNFAGTPENFANTLLGTGVVDSYANTQPGFQGNEAGEMARNGADNTRALEVARIQAQAEMDRLNYATTTPLAPGAKGAGGGGSVTPLTIQPGTAEKFAELITGQVQQMHPGAVLDPQTVQRMVSDATVLFQQNRNADAAIAQVLSGLSTTTQDESWWPTGDTTRGTYVGGAAPAPAAAPPPTAPTAAPSASATVPPTAPPAAPAAAPQAAPVYTATNANGRKIMWDATQGAWVPVGPTAAP